VSCNFGFMLQGILPIKKSDLIPDILAGITLAALGIPEVMGYSKIIDLPLVTGLYTMLLPMIVFALFGSSRHLVVGADSATAAIVAASLISLSIPAHSAAYFESAKMIALMAGGMLLLARIFRVGFIADFMSRTVLIGFLTGVGLQVAFGELPHVLGIPKVGHSFFSQMTNMFENIGQTDKLNLLISVVTIGIIVLSEKVIPRFPGALIVVVGMMIASASLHWSEHGISVIGTVPGGLPRLNLPSLPWNELLKLLPVSFSCFIVILAQSAATSRAYAVRYREGFNENSDLVGLALANFASACSNSFVINGSPTKTAMVDGARGKSQIAQLATTCVVLIVLLFLTSPLSYLPTAVLASIVLLIGAKLVDIRGLQSIKKAKPKEFVLALVTTIIVVVVGVEEGILIAITLSLLQHVQRSYQPNTGLILHDSRDQWRMDEVTSDSFIEPGMIMYWFGADLFYANANSFSQQLRSLVSETRPTLVWLVVDASALTRIDYSAGLVVKELCKNLSEERVVLAFTRVSDKLRSDFDQLGLTKLIGEDHLFLSRSSCIQAYRQVRAGAV
jgi:SulP family sulfate permease